jgi:hypothetical protein
MEVASLLPHVPFVVVYLVAGTIAALRYRRSPARMTWLLVGLCGLLFQRLVEVWMTISIPTDVPNSDTVATANFVRRLVYLSWALAVGGLICVVVAALKSDANQSTGAMPNTSLERTRGR